RHQCRARQWLQIASWAILVLCYCDLTSELRPPVMNHFSLHPRLAADSHLITHLPLCELRLMDDARYPWLILIPRRPAISEVFELSERDQQQMWREATQLGQALKQQYQGDKINIATLGNMVAQLHLHVILRHQDDPAWP